MEFLITGKSGIWKEKNKKEINLNRVNDDIRTIWPWKYTVEIRIILLSNTFNWKYTLHFVFLSQPIFGISLFRLSAILRRHYYYIIFVWQTDTKWQTVPKTKTIQKPNAIIFFSFWMQSKVKNDTSKLGYLSHCKL